MLITKAICDQVRCGREFNVPDGGFSILATTVESITILIKPAEINDDPCYKQVCGKECLHILIDEKLDEYLDNIRKEKEVKND